ncbi:MAG TPA: hypothetical protein V6D17_08280 [Candidatus Obscuribacterales bacterium]
MQTRNSNSALWQAKHGEMPVSYSPSYGPGSHASVWLRSQPPQKMWLSRLERKEVTPPARGRDNGAKSGRRGNRLRRMQRPTGLRAMLIAFVRSFLSFNVCPAIRV